MVLNSQSSWSKLVQVMACCLMAPSHYLNQSWLTISEFLRHSPERNFTFDAQTNVLCNELENCTFRISAISPMCPWVKSDNVSVVVYTCISCALLHAMTMFTHVCIVLPYDISCNLIAPLNQGKLYIVLGVKRTFFQLFFPSMENIVCVWEAFKQYVPWVQVSNVREILLWSAGQNLSHRIHWSCWICKFAGDLGPISISDQTHKVSNL